MQILMGITLLLLTLALFSIFTFKMPKGQKAMSGLANAAVVTFLVEAVHKYISGDLIGINFLGEVGTASGDMGGVAAAALVGLSMGINPIYALAAGVALSGYGILPGFIAGYIIALIAPTLEKKLPEGLDIIMGVLILAPLTRFIAFGADPIVTLVLGTIGTTIAIAAEQSPIFMGFFLGGIIKMICTSPLSSMALTAMLGFQGLAMGIASIACVGGAVTNGIIFHRLKLGDKSKVIAVVLEPLTQVDIVTQNALPIYISNFFGGALSGIAAAYFGIINNAPGTASPIPGLLAPFGFNPPLNVIFAVAAALLGGLIAGEVGARVTMSIRAKRLADNPQ